MRSRSIAPITHATAKNAIPPAATSRVIDHTRSITLPLLRPLLAIQLLFLVIYTTYQFVIPNVMLGNDPGPHADLLMTLIVRQSFSNNLFGYGSAVSVLLMLAMFVWVAIWYRAFKRDLEIA